MSSSAILNPLTGQLAFGQVDSLILSGLKVPAASIYLPSGRHIGPNRGFGAIHIWAEHRVEMQKAGYEKAAEVPLYVLDIIQIGTPLFFEGASWQSTRLMAVRSTRGTAILEFKDRREGPAWSIVTAFSGTKTHGTRVGTVR